MKSTINTKHIQIKYFRKNTGNGIQVALWLYLANKLCCFNLVHSVINVSHVCFCFSMEFRIGKVEEKDRKWPKTMYVDQYNQ